MIELVEGFWCDPWEVTVVKAINKKSCALWVSGQSAMDGFVLDYPAEEVVEAIDDARAEEDDEEESDD